MVYRVSWRYARNRAPCRRRRNTGRARRRSLRSCLRVRLGPGPSTHLPDLISSGAGSAVAASVCRPPSRSPEDVSRVPRRWSAAPCRVRAFLRRWSRPPGTPIRSAYNRLRQQPGFEEPFGRGQKGSSAMPHKKNPIICERISGMARLLRGNATTAMENIALWHERDISHSSVERVILPDSTITLYYMLHKTLQIIKGMNVHPENMLQNLNKTKGLIYSQPLLLNLIEKGLSREEAYKVVQRNAMLVWEKNMDFVEILSKDDKIGKYLEKTEIELICNLETRLKNVNYIFKKLKLI